MTQFASLSPRCWLVAWIDFHLPGANGSAAAGICRQQEGLLCVPAARGRKGLPERTAGRRYRAGRMSLTVCCSQYDRAGCGAVLRRHPGIRRSNRDPTQNIVCNHGGEFIWSVESWAARAALRQASGICVSACPAAADVERNYLRCNNDCVARRWRLAAAVCDSTGRALRRRPAAVHWLVSCAYGGDVQALQRLMRANSNITSAHAAELQR